MRKNDGVNSNTVGDECVAGLMYLLNQRPNWEVRRRLTQIFQAGKQTKLKGALLEFMVDLSSHEPITTSGKEQPSKGLPKEPSTETIVQKEAAGKETKTTVAAHATVPVTSKHRSKRHSSSHSTVARLMSADDLVSRSRKLSDRTTGRKGGKLSFSKSNDKNKSTRDFLFPKKSDSHIPITGSEEDEKEMKKVDPPSRKDLLTLPRKPVVDGLPRSSSAEPCLGGLSNALQSKAQRVDKKFETYDVQPIATGTAISDAHRMNRATKQPDYYISIKGHEDKPVVQVDPPSRKDLLPLPHKPVVVDGLQRSSSAEPYFASYSVKSKAQIAAEEEVDKVQEQPTVAPAALTAAGNNTTCSPPCSVLLDTSRSPPNASHTSTASTTSTTAESLLGPLKKNTKIGPPPTAASMKISFPGPLKSNNGLRRCVSEQVIPSSSRFMTNRKGERVRPEPRFPLLLHEDDPISESKEAQSSEATSSYAILGPLKKYNVGPPPSSRGGGFYKEESSSNVTGRLRRCVSVDQSSLGNTRRFLLSPPAGSRQATGLTHADKGQIRQMLQESVEQVKSIAQQQQGSCTLVVSPGTAATRWIPTVTTRSSARQQSQSSVIRGQQQQHPLRRRHASNGSQEDTNHHAKLRKSSNSPLDYSLPPVPLHESPRHAPLGLAGNFSSSSFGSLDGMGNNDAVFVNE